MDEKEEAYKEIAKRQDMMFNYRSAPYIFTTMFDNDPILLYRYKALFGLGNVLDHTNNPNSRHGDRRSGANLFRGQYKWEMERKEAYQFCLGIRPHLATHDPYRHQWCEKCIRTYENNPN